MPKWPTSVWAGLLAVAVLVAWLWHDYVSTPADTKWSDPHQPPAQLPLLVGVSGIRPPRITGGETYLLRTYPGCLADWSGCVAGDC